MEDASIATWGVLRDFGFEPNVAVISDSSPGLSFDFGNFRLSASRVTNMSFADIVLFTGVLSTRRTLGQVQFEMPRQVTSRGQCAAWIVWHLDQFAVGRVFIPAREVDWVIEGRQNKNLLPWVVDLAAYQARPQCLVQREWLRVALKTLRGILDTVDDNAAVVFAFDSEVLKIRCAGKVVALPAEGISWPKRYLISAGQLGYLRGRLMRESLEVSIWKGKLHIGSWAYDGIEETPDAEDTPAN